MKPWEFWHLTQGEFYRMLAGFWRREDREWQRIGTLGLWITGQYSGKKMTLEKLLGRALRTLPIWRP